MQRIKKYLRQLLLSPEKVFITLALFFGVLSAFMMPQLAVADEWAHFLRSYNLASGSLGTVNCSYPVLITDNVKPGDRPLKISFKTTINYKTTSYSKPTTEKCGSASSYSPFMHLPQAIGIFVAKAIYPSLKFMILAGRLANVIFYVTVLYFIIKYVRIGKWTFVVIGLLPLFIHIAGSVSSDVMNNVVVLAFIACMLSAFTIKGRLGNRHLILLIILGFLLPLTKLPNIILFLPLLFLPRRAFAENPKWLKKVPFSFYKYIMGILMIITAIGGVLLWQKIYQGPLIAAVPNNPLEHHPLHLLRIIYNTYINPMIGYENLVFNTTTGVFSFKFNLPNYIICLTWITILFSLFVTTKREGILPDRLIRILTVICLVTIALLVAVITYALYTGWAIRPSDLGPGALYADGVQGRYFTALIALLIPLGIYLRQFITINTKKPIYIGVIIFILCAFELLFYITETYYYSMS